LQPFLIVCNTANNKNVKETPKNATNENQACAADNEEQNILFKTMICT